MCVHTYMQAHTHILTYTNTRTFVCTCTHMYTVYLAQVCHESLTDIFLVFFIEQLQLPQLFLTIAEVKGLSSGKPIPKRGHNLRMEETL